MVNPHKVRSFCKYVEYRTRPNVRALVGICVRPPCGLVKQLYPRGVRPLCGYEYWSLIRSVHFVDLVKQLTLMGIRPVCEHEFWSLMGSVPFVDSVKQLTLVGSVHFVNWILIPHGVRPLCGFSQTINPRGGPSSLWTWILIPYGVRPLCGLCQTINPRGVRPLYGLNIDPSWDPSFLWTLSNS